jgi:hypothetical protein
MAISNNADYCQVLYKWKSEKCSQQLGKKKTLNSYEEIKKNDVALFPIDVAASLYCISG